MNAVDQVLSDLKARRDALYQEAGDSRMRAEMLDYVTAMLQNAIRKDAIDNKEDDHGNV